jgi:hypothetical protein
MNHFILSEKDLNRNQFLDSNAKSGLYLLDSTIDISNLGNSLAFAENISMQYQHDITIQCQNQYISLKQFLRSYLLNEKLSRTINGPTNYPLLRFKDSDGLNIWENFESQAKNGGKFEVASVLNINNGIIIKINDFKVINGGSLLNNYIYLKFNSIVGSNISFNIRFSKTGLAVINNYDNSLIGSLTHDLTEEHTFIIAIKYDSSAIQMGFHFYGKDETVYTTAFYNASINQATGGTNILSLNNGLTLRNQSCSLSGIDLFENTGLSFVASIPALNAINLIYNSFNLYDTILDTKLVSNAGPNSDCFYTFKYNNDKLGILYGGNTNSFFMMYNKTTDTFYNKKTVGSIFSGKNSKTANARFLVDNNIIYFLQSIDSYPSGMYSDNEGLTWKSLQDGTLTNNLTFAFKNIWYGGSIIYSQCFSIGYDNNAMIYCQAIANEIPHIVQIDKDSSNNLWMLSNRYAFGRNFVGLIKTDLNGTLLGYWERHEFNQKFFISIIGSYIYLLSGYVGVLDIIKLDITNPDNIISRNGVLIDFSDYIVENTICNDGTYIYAGSYNGKIYKINTTDLSFATPYTVTLPTNKELRAMDHNSTDGYLYFVTKTAGKIYKVSSTFTGETSYNLTGFLADGYYAGLVVYEAGGYIFVNEQSATVSKVFRFTIAGTTTISSALSTANHNGRGRIFVDASYVICLLENSFDRFTYPGLSNRQTYVYPSGVEYFSYGGSYYNSATTRLYIGFPNGYANNKTPVGATAYTTNNLSRFNISALPLALEPQYRINDRAFALQLTSFTNLRNIKNNDTIYAYYINYSPYPSNYDAYGKYVGLIDLNISYMDIPTIDMLGVCIFKIPSSNNFILIYHNYNIGTSQYDLYGQQINFNGTNFTISGSPVILIANVGKPDDRYLSIHNLYDSANNIYYLFFASTNITVQKNVNLYCAYNTTGNLFSGWNLISGQITKSLPGTTNDLFTALFSLSFFNDDLIRIYPFSNPNGYSEVIPYNFGLIQSNIKYKKPSLYFSFVPSMSYTFASKDSASYFIGDASFALFMSYSPKVILDSNSINKEATSVFSIITDGINIKFGGSVMYDFDKLYLKSDFQIKGDEVASISPSEVWKSQSDLSMARITFDATLNGNSNLKFIFNSFGLVNTNFRTAKIIACNDGDFSTPDFSQTIYSNYMFQDRNGTYTYSDTIVSISDNYIKFTNLNSNKLNLFSLVGKYIETAGTVKKVYKIINCDKYGIYTSGNPSTDGVLAGDTIYLFTDRFLDVTTNFDLESSIQKYRYIGIEIPIQPTYDGYFQIGKFLIGLGLKLTYARSVPYSDSLSSGVQINKSIGMQSYPVINHKPLFETEIAWNKLRKEGKYEVETFLQHTELNKYNFIFCNNPISLTKNDFSLNSFQLVRLSNDYELSHELGDDSIFVISLNLVEEL